jgi:peptide/nickel transport system substrate-binding protein
MPPEMLRELPGYNPDVAKSRAEARKIMERLGYGPDKRLKVKVSIRNIAPTRDPAIILIDHLKEIYIDGDLEPVDTTQWYPKIRRKDFTVGMVVSENALDDPDQQFYENFTCDAERNYTGYCNPELDKLIDRQSMELDIDKRRQMVWQIVVNGCQPGSVAHVWRYGILRLLRINCAYDPRHSDGNSGSGAARALRDRDHLAAPHGGC